MSIIEYFLPPRCAICREILGAGTHIHLCGKCVTEIGYYNNAINSLFTENRVGTTKINEVECYCDGVICIGKYSDALKETIKRFKFSDKPSHFRVFGELLALKVQNTLDDGMIDVIIPVPLHKNKLKQRGYNQAELIASYTSKLLGIPCEKNILIKSVETKSQSLLTKSERMHNVEGMFDILDNERVRNKKVLLVDDVITTGSTLNQCSKVLKQAGAKYIIAGVIATTRQDRNTKTGGGVYARR